MTATVSKVADIIWSDSSTRHFTDKNMKSGRPHDNSL